MKNWKKVLGIVFIILLVGIAGFLVWAGTPAKPDPQALAAASQAEELSDGTLVFLPADSSRATGVIFYPGGRVDYRAYAPLALALSKAGFPVYLLKMPLNLAVFDPNAALRIVESHPEIRRWAIGGHSLGGSMAAFTIFEHPDLAADLFLLASYPAQNNNLSDRSDLRVLSISASMDGLATPQKIAQSRALLPPDAQYLEIVGGNHAYFGYYGEQPGDGQAVISREAQQAQVLEALIFFLNANSE